MTRDELLAIAKPILFSTNMVQAILDDKKTATRRVVKGYAAEHIEIDVDGSVIGVYDQFEGCVRPATEYARYKPGDILYVRETWTPGCMGGYIYKAGHEYADDLTRLKQWRPSIHMPKEAARIFLRVTVVRCERLQDISVADVWAEGTTLPPIDEPECSEEAYARFAFQVLWESTIKQEDADVYGWNANPWVWVYNFERVCPEELL